MIDYANAGVDAVTRAMDRQHMREDEARDAPEKKLLRNLDLFFKDFWCDIDKETQRKIIKASGDYAEIGRIVSKAILEPAGKYIEG